MIARSSPTPICRLCVTTYELRVPVTLLQGHKATLLYHVKMYLRTLNKWTHTQKTSDGSDSEMPVTGGTDRNKTYCKTYYDKRKLKS